MEACASSSSGRPSSFEPNTEAIKRRLINKGVFPTPKIVRALRKKETLKLIRRSKGHEKPLSESQRMDVEEEAHFRTVAREYRTVMRVFKSDRAPTFSLPWDGAKGISLRELASDCQEFGGEMLKEEGLIELRDMLAQRKRESYQWLLEDDLEEGFPRDHFVQRGNAINSKRQIGDTDRVKSLIDRLSSGNLSMEDWRFSSLMKQTGIQFTEKQLLRIVGELGAHGHWKQALSIVEWAFRGKGSRHFKSRFVYTKLLAVLGKAGRANEALQIFNRMQEDYLIYPDMAAYHSIAVTLGQAGLLKELINIVECMKRKPSKKIRNMRRKNWDKCLEPDLVIFNAVLNACVPSQQWKGVSWVFRQIRHYGLKANGATYGLAMEVMLKSGKHELVYKFFGRMLRCGLAPKALTYKVLVRSLWEEGKVNEAIEAVTNMEERGVVGTASVYYELACCLSYNGRWQEAMLQVEKLKTLSPAKPLEVAFTGMIKSCMDGGHAHDCISIFEGMKCHCSPNIGTINAMLKVFGRIDMFAKAKELFEEIKTYSGCTPDAYSYTLMLLASAHAHQWEYFEHLYKEMLLHGFQIDQDRHAQVLVEASKAGKFHLLEHAFDSVLEAGEIPHVSLFTEMICQHLEREDYERVISLINGMGHTSIQMSEKQWTDLLMRNKHRFTKYKLVELSDIICNSRIMTEEAVVSNFLRSFKSLCEPCASKESALSDAADDSGFRAGGVDVDADANANAAIGRKLQHSLPSKTGEHSFQSNLLRVNNDDVSDMFPVYDTNDSEDEDDGDSGPRNNASAGCISSKLPSASMILETWRENQLKDGIFPFQL